MKRSVKKAQPSSKRGRPPKITREEIISALLRSKTKATFLGIAKHLDVSPQALYRHVGSISEIVGMAAQDIAGRYPFPPDNGEDWYNWAYKCAQVLKKFYESLPNLADYANSPEEIDVVLLRYEVSLEIARRSGIDDLDAYWATGMVSEFVRGWVTREQRHSMKRKSKIQDPRSLLRAIKMKERKEFPLLAAALHKSDKKGLQKRFDYMLHRILSGIAYENGHVFVLVKTLARSPQRATRRAAS